MSKPEYLKSGERARLLPVVSESNKENRLIGPVLAALPIIHELAQSLLGELGTRIGARAKISCFTEIVFKDQDDFEITDRPDGLIVVNTGRSEWRCLVEAKFGNAKLSEAQLERYLKLAIHHKVDAVLTISNEFTATPTHSPVTVSPKLTKKCELYHLSWSVIATTVDLLLGNKEVEDPDRALVLEELHAYLRHKASQITGFTQMNKEWKDVVKAIISGAKLPKSDPGMLGVVSCWHQEQKDMCIVLSNLVNRQVTLKLPRAHLESPQDWQKSTIEELLSDGVLTSKISVPNAAGLLEVEANLRRRIVAFGLKLKAPEDKKSTQARVSWLLRQIKDAADERLMLRIHYPGRKDYQDYKLLELLEDVSPLKKENGIAANYLELRLVDDQAGRFTGSKAFIEDTETALEVFYTQVVANVKAWQPSAPKPVEKTMEASSELEG